MQKRTSSSCEREDNVQGPSDPREFEAMRSLIVPAAIPSDTEGNREPVISQRAWLTSGELRSGVLAANMHDLAAATDVAEIAEDSITGVEQAMLHDTLPSPPPSPDEVA